MTGMKAVLLALSAALALTTPALAQQVPSKIARQIKAKCVAEYPDDYTLQAGCIRNQSRAYLEVHGGESQAPNIDVTGIPSAADRAAINNAAYLSVARDRCGIKIGTMVMRYTKKAASSGRLTAGQIGLAVAAGIKDQDRAARQKPRAFCAEAKRNLPNFKADLAHP